MFSATSFQFYTLIIWQITYLHLIHLLEGKVTNFSIQYHLVSVLRDGFLQDQCRPLRSSLG